MCFLPAILKIKSKIRQQNKHWNIDNPQRSSTTPVCVCVCVSIWRRLLLILQLAVYGIHKHCSSTAASNVFVCRIFPDLHHVWIRCSRCISNLQTNYILLKCVCLSFFTINYTCFNILYVMQWHLDVTKNTIWRHRFQRLYIVIWKKRLFHLQVPNMAASVDLCVCVCVCSVESIPRCCIQGETKSNCDEEHSRRTTQFTYTHH